MRNVFAFAAVFFFACGGRHQAGPDAGPDASPPDAAGRCGNSDLDTGEKCDDGNTMPGDGCNASCQIEPGWICIAPGSPCLHLMYCGDGHIDPPEMCDDGNAMPGDGCSGACGSSPTSRVDAGATVRVDDRAATASSRNLEACDDGTTAGTHGCSADCMMVTAG
jgi:cysteine-rich repeat protein